MYALVIAVGVDPNLAERGCSAVYCAAEADQPEVVQALAEAGANLEAQSPEGLTPLMHAAQLGRAECADVLVRAGANVNANTNSAGATALMLAALSGHAACVESLVQAPGGDLEAKSPNNVPTRVYDE